MKKKELKSSFETKFEITRISKLQITCLTALQDGRIGVGTRENLIRIMEPKNEYQSELILEGHTDEIVALLQLPNGLLISASKDYTFKIWTITFISYNLEFTIKKTHLHRITDLTSLTNDRFASCSIEGKIKLWHTEFPYRIIDTIDNKEINSIYQIKQVKNKELLLAISDTIASIWDLETYEVVKIVKELQLTSPYYSFTECDDENIYFIDDRKIKLFNLTTFTFVREFIEGVQLMIKLRDGNFLLFKGYDFFVYDIKTQKMEQVEVDTDDNYCSINSLSPMLFFKPNDKELLLIESEKFMVIRY